MRVDGVSVDKAVIEGTAVTCVVSGRDSGKRSGHGSRRYSGRGNWICGGQDEGAVFDVVVGVIVV